MGLGAIRLADFADSAALSRGIGIASSSRSVVDRTVRTHDDLTIIAGRVAAASKTVDFYDCAVLFSDWEARIVDYECTCADSVSAQGLCRHCVALATVYFAQPHTFERQSPHQATEQGTRLGQVESSHDWNRIRPGKGKVAFYFDAKGKKEQATIRLTVKVFYGEREVVLAAPRDAAENQELRPATSQGFRDQALEDRAFELACRYFDGSMELSVRQTQEAGSLLYEGLTLFNEVGEVFTTTAFDRLMVERPIRVRLGLSLSGNLIQLDVRESDLSRDELLALLGSYRCRKQYHRLSDGRIAALEAGDVANLAAMALDLGVSAETLVAKGVELPTYQAFYLDREYRDVVHDASFDSYVRRMDKPPEPLEEPRGLTLPLRGYQKEGVRWLATLKARGFGGVLADEMGLGKTIQMIALIASLEESGALDGPVLVACPASVVFNWVEECGRFAPALSVIAYDGSKEQRTAILSCVKDAQAGLLSQEESSGVNAPLVGAVPRILVASYDRVRIDGADLAVIDWGLVVLDEAQRIKNHATKTTRAIKRLRSSARFALTGTPLENRPAELWSLFDFLMPGLLGTYEQFRARYELAILGGDEQATLRLQTLLEPFVLRRLKTDVLEDLPEKSEQVRMVALGSEQRRLYDGVEQKLREELNAQKKRNASRKNRRGQLDEKDKTAVDVLAEITRLREIALDPALVFENYRGGAEKKGAILELVDEAMDARRKVLIFSQFTRYLEILSDALSRKGVAHFMLTGSTPKQQRVLLVDRFNRDETPVFLVSLKAGGVGLNLTGASVVIHADPWWNAAVVDQATDRAHRIGQKRTVDVYKVVAEDTIEQRVMELQRAKRNLADNLVNPAGGEAAFMLTRERLETLLGL